MQPSLEENFDWLSKERELWGKGFRLVAGVDEAGRGPLAGPVVAAAVIIKPGTDLPGVIDSKQMTGSQREEIYPSIIENCLAVGVSASSVSVIDRINILAATMRAMKRSIDRLGAGVDYVLVDGNHFPQGIDIAGETVIEGDRLCRSIAAASVVAKVIRDRLMMRLDRFYPQFGFARNKGYGTDEHIRAIRKFGPTVHHRYSFSPVRQHQFNFENDDRETE